MGKTNCNQRQTQAKGERFTSQQGSVKFLVCYETQNTNAMADIIAKRHVSVDCNV